MKKEYVFLDLKNYKKEKYIECIKVNDECKINVLKYEFTYYYSSTPYRAKTEEIAEKPAKPREIYKFENDGNLSNEKTKEIMSELDDFLRKQNS